MYGLLRVALDGTVWVRQPHRGAMRNGIHAFDGTSWKHYLEGDCVADLEIAPDGSVWVLTGTGFGMPYAGEDSSEDLYRIDPSAVVETP